MCCKCDSQWKNPGLGTKVPGQESSHWEDEKTIIFVNNNEYLMRTIIRAVIMQVAVLYASSASKFIP